jgi:hypothetical protein
MKTNDKRRKSVRGGRRQAERGEEREMGGMANGCFNCRPNSRHHFAGQREHDA